MELGLKRLFCCNHMIKKDQILGTFPSNKKIYKETLNLAWPSAIERLLVSLVGAMDTMMVGGLGAGAIAAIGITQQPTFILLAIIFSLNIGVTAIVARRFGEKDYKKANQTLRQSIVLVMVLSLCLACIGFIYARPILKFMGAEDAIMLDAITYFRIILIGMFFNALSLNINAAQRGAGNTKVAMYANITANLANLCTNYLLIHGHFGFPALGVKGAAIGTITGNIISFLIALYCILASKTPLKLNFKESWRLDALTLKGIFNISSSAMIEQLCMRIGFLSYTKIITSLGTVAFATHQICLNILNITFSVGDGMSMAASSLVGRYLGAKRSDLSIVYGKTAQRIGQIFSVFAAIGFLVFGAKLVGLFTTESDIIALGTQLMLIIAMISPVQISQVIVSGALRGSGDTKFVAGTSFISILLVRPIVTYILCYPLGLGLIGAWLSILFDQGLRLIINYLRFSSGKWIHIKL